MLLPENHEKLHIISEVLSEQVGEHIENGGTYYDETATLMAARAIHDIMPELIDLHKSKARVSLRASRATLLESRMPYSVEDLMVEAQLASINFQGIISTYGTGDNTMTLSSFDLCAVLRPQYTKPDPVDIVFGDELYVPFMEIGAFDEA